MNASFLAKADALQGVLEDAEYIYNNAIDVAPDMYGTKAAAASIYTMMQERSYSTEACSQHDFHPSPAQGFSDVDMVNFIFTVDLLNFSFWSELPEDQRFQVEYQGGRWMGYKSLVACLRRGIEEGVPITTPRYWRKGCSTYDELRHVFRSATEEEIPLLNQRIEILREAAEVLHNVCLSHVQESISADFVEFQRRGGGGRRLEWRSRAGH